MVRLWTSLVVIALLLAAVYFFWHSSGEDAQIDQYRTLIEYHNGLFIDNVAAEEQRLRKTYEFDARAGEDVAELLDICGWKLVFHEVLVLNHSIKSNDSCMGVIVQRADVVPLDRFSGVIDLGTFGAEGYMKERSYLLLHSSLFEDGFAAKSFFNETRGILKTMNTAGIGSVYYSSDDLSDVRLGFFDPTNVDESYRASTYYAQFNGDQDMYVHYTLVQRADFVHILKEYSEVQYPTYRLRALAMKEDGIVGFNEALRGDEI